MKKLSWGGKSFAGNAAGPFFKAGLLAAVGFACSCATGQAAQFYNFANVVGSAIQFNGITSSFQFDANGAGNEWTITSETGQPSGSVLGLLGTFTGGPWTYGPITTTAGGLIQSANIVASAASLSIKDGASQIATADVLWGTVSTFQSFGGLNASLTVNLSNLSYTGANSDLAAFFSNPSGALDVTFNFNPNGTLTQLTTGTGPYLSSFSGSLSAVPEPSTWSILSLGLAFGTLLVYRRSKSPAR